MADQSRDAKLRRLRRRKRELFRISRGRGKQREQNPTEQEIRARCEEVQSTWSYAERERRACGNTLAERWEPPSTRATR